MKPFQFFGYIHEVIASEISTDLRQCGSKAFAHLMDFVFILISLGYVKKQRLIPDPSNACLEKPCDNSLAVCLDIHQLYWQDAVHQVAVCRKSVMECITRYAQDLAVAKARTEECVFSPGTRRIIERIYSWRLCKINTQIGSRYELCMVYFLNFFRFIIRQDFDVGIGGAAIFHEGGYIIPINNVIADSFYKQTEI